MSMEQVTFDPSRKHSFCFQKFNIPFQFSSLNSSFTQIQYSIGLAKQNNLKKYTIFKQKTKLIVKTISKHFQTFIYLFLIQEISENGKKRLKEITRLCMKKSLTEAGRERKKRIAHKLFHKRITTNLQLYFYISALPLFKSFVLVF